ncbi:16S rRNA (cytosine(967)-C(5))-methyltransferase RsmB [Acetonema longum]|uniref:16S rRNA (cytosine(967)-C(5))-methyltransferase n=1 Tax=Acetonema longum DSM 6540 TaxID=1009370 RepID=F7NLE6_9FIRM|nr:16S rRNA (cytosine(967)-C(5))-methyltransferase RsmB [Acetonema longum]EGO63251.1 16S rRNA methyltransferase B [Acetonema longum DSM 6540]
MNAREAALLVIQDIEQNQAYANIALAKAIERQTLSNQDRRFMTELVYGTVKAQNTLNWLLSHYCSRSLDKISPVIRNILRMGIYQLFFLDRIPVSAACNQAVELTKKYGHAGTVKFVNAVLRNAARTLDKPVYPDPANHPDQYLSLRYYHPEWMIERWLTRYGFAFCEELCASNNLTPPLSLRTNTLKISRDDLLDRLTAEQATATPSDWTPEGLVCTEHPALASMPSLQEGLFQVQDESSMLVAHVLGPQPGEFIIDACGAPGGKSTHIAALMNNSGKVLATDLYEHKLALIRENAKRLGIHCLETRQMDAVKLNSLYKNQADRVLVDAPCSGLGVLRRKPDSRWRKNEKLLRALPDLQSAILHSSADCVKPGGILVYSTCTIEPEENQDVVNGFLASRRDFVLEHAGRLMPVPRPEQPEKMMQLFPHIDGVDGFFIARLRRVGDRADD